MTQTDREGDKCTTVAKEAEYAPGNKGGEQRCRR